MWAIHVVKTLALRPGSMVRAPEEARTNYDIIFKQ